ncbi:MAG: aspartate aminotransferase family protein [Pseudomonadota bacterium]|nr:aspartate aminotransferase family protein [Pseudomonadota bacterium]
MKSLSERDRRSIGAVQKLRFFPVALTGGKGVRVLDEAGRSLLDLSAAWGSASLGYGHPRLVAALERAVRNPAGASILSSVTRPAIELAEALLERLPQHKNHKVVLGHSGSDVIESALRAIAAATGRSRFVSFAGAYHGGTSASMSISGHPVQAHASRHPGLALVPYPAGGSRPDGDAVYREIEELFATRVPPHEVGAFFIEPLQSDGGMLVPTPGFFARLAGLCARHGILTVCDEVKVGLARSGKLHCFEHEGFLPDVVCFGKGLGGGQPIAALVAPAPILDHATSFAMQTLHGNPLSATAGLAVLETIAAEGLARNAAEVGGYLMQRLTGLKARHEIIVDVRGRGLAVGIELAAAIPRAAAQVVYRAFELGLIVYYVGVGSNVLELTPPLIFSNADVDEAIGILEQALGDVEAGRFDSSKLAAFAGW